MTVIGGWCITAVVVLLIVPTVLSQQPTDGPADGNGSIIIAPTEIDDDVDVFVRKEKEYLVVNRRRKFRQAMYTCQDDFQGSLAIVDNDGLAFFLAEALSETDLIFDAVWIAGQKVNETWMWLKGNSTTEISADIIGNLSKVTEVEANDRDCIAFARLNHDLPNYRSLTCKAQRAILCERPRSGGPGNSTHPGWIRIGQRLYKIFAEMVPYEAAGQRCYSMDRESQLAVVPTMKEVKTLARYLLIGRPSLENAWIGARFIHSEYAFEPEVLVLKNETDGETGYPPWREKKVQKVNGCILLDRHLANGTFFVEARCERNRAYICYKFANDSRNESTTDVIFDNDAYRLVFAKKIWTAARDHCEINYAKYNSYLSEVSSVEKKNQLLYVMGENRTAVQHIWIGGMFDTTKEGWVWQHSKTDIPNDEPMNWVTNTSYDAEVEKDNICLNMDRENHLAALHYGTTCNTPQFFVCYFTPDMLRQLEHDEMNQKNENPPEA